MQNREFWLGLVLLAVHLAVCAALWLHTSFAWQDLLGFAAILVMAVLIALPERTPRAEQKNI